jgi:subtilisin family serine protease
LILIYLLVGLSFWVDYRGLELCGKIGGIPFGVVGSMDLSTKLCFFNSHPRRLPLPLYIHRDSTLKCQTSNMKILRLAQAFYVLALAAAESYPANDEDPLKKGPGMDSILLKLVQNYRARAGDASLLKESHGPANAAVQDIFPAGMLFAADGRLIVEVMSVEPNTKNLVMVLEEMGATVNGCFSLVEGRCSATVEIADLPTLAASALIKWISAVIEAQRTPPVERSGQRKALVGSVESQASQAVYADLARERFNVDGSGIKVCVISDSFDKAANNPKTRAADDVALGDLPSFERMDIVRDNDISPGNDEGRAMMQIVHDVAPGANLGFYTGAYGISAIVDDFLISEESMFQDDLVAQAADYAHDQGVAYFSSAGNFARQSVEFDYEESSEEVYGKPRTMLFDDGKGDTIHFLRVEFPAPTGIIMAYDEPTEYAPGLPGPAMNMDLYVFKAGTDEIVAESDADNLKSGQPTESAEVAAGTYDIVVQRFSGPQPGLVKFIFTVPFIPVNFDPIFSPTSFGHCNARGAIAVGAANYPNTPGFDASPAIQAPYSSAGGVPILFDLMGQRLADGEVRKVPAFTAVDGGCTNFFGEQDVFDTGDQNCYNFKGTSASAPVAAAVAALMLHANPDLAPDDIRHIMEHWARLSECREGCKSGY